MRRIPRIVLLAVFVAVLPALAGCADFDPDKLDVFGLSEKKKLPGERKPLFPEGVPGVTQGVPPEYIKGNEAAAADAPLTPLPAEPAAEDQRKAAAAGEAVVESQPAAKPAAKPKPKRTAARKPAPKVAAKPNAAKPNAAAPVQPVAQQPAEPWPAPAQQQQPPQQQASPWPAAQPAQGSAANSPWPAAPPSGSLSR